MGDQGSFFSQSAYGEGASQAFGDPNITATQLGSQIDFSFLDLATQHDDQRFAHLPEFDYGASQVRRGKRGAARDMPPQLEGSGASSSGSEALWPTVGCRSRRLQGSPRGRQSRDMRGRRRQRPT